jgi:hypothetical protein
VGRSAIQVLHANYPNFEIVGTSRTLGKIELAPEKSIPLITLEQALENKNDFNAMVHTAFPTQNYIKEKGQGVYEQEAALINTWLEKFGAEVNFRFILGVSSGVVELRERGLDSATKDPYARHKAREEQILRSFNSNGISIGRLWAGSGRFIRNFRIYALGQFLESALKGQDVIIKTKEQVFRRYCDVEQFCHVGIALAISGANLTFDSGGVLISIKDLAQKVASLFPGIETQFAEKTQGLSNQPSDYYSKSLKFEAFAQEFAIDLLGIDDQISRTASAIRALLER